MSELTCTPYNNNNDQPRYPHEVSTSAPLYELQEVIQQYKAHPELLKLILTSKVEEDKRRAEEAKLRAKELDYYLKHDSPPPPTTTSIPETISTSQQKYQRKISIPTRQPQQDRGPYPSIQQSLSPSSRRESFDQHQQRRNSAAAAMLAMGSSGSNYPTLLPSLSPTSPSTTDPNLTDEEMEQSAASSAYPSPVPDHYEDQEENTTKPRRRREMQAITKIVETRDFPYMDSYFWRNNGNTTQKKTGCRSIYYKCSNSNKGCQVNKTVTAKQNGEYLIKYRGTHLPECGMVERIRDL
ncbi:uncharacterized protein BX664DRAFT_341435 [Halteromyces radiatus]|uniref:uncharacterized protein n=1 Tax=Halteromyces radiatus TaxID=101107 RepID=UPI00221E64EE|nr:uncharacterized protein BX664DRAFT_341435 [Halteromyces radiatus]KAI8079779.1 hypothetical protein BX664DRAFT_341435 [Halteromyces radiatus]